MATEEGNKRRLCKECGEEILPKRLKQVPGTTLCFDCKTKQEEKEKFLKAGPQHAFRPVRDDRNRNTFLLIREMKKPENKKVSFKYF